MEISSYTSNIQPYGSPNGTKIASSESGGVPSVSSPKESSAASKIAEKTQELTMEAAVEMAEKRQELNKLERERLVEKMNEFVTSINRGVSFKVDESSGRDVVTIYEARTGDVIRQIPDEEMLEILRRLAEHTASSGLLVEKV